MPKSKIKWGNILIVFLIIAAGIAAIYYKDPVKFEAFFGHKETIQKAAEMLDDDNPSDETGIASDIINSSSGSSRKGSDEQLIPGAIVPASDTFIMGLDSWIGGTPALIALSREYNKDYSLNLKLSYITNDRDRITALNKGEIHATEMTLPAFLRFQQEFPNAGVIVGITDFSRGADGIIARSGINTLNDMEDKTVSYVGDGTGKFILNKFLRLTGLRYQDIKPIERDEMGEVIEDLKSGNADLVVSWSPDMNLAVKDINESNPESVKMLITTKEVPDLVPTVLVINKKVAEDYPDEVAAFLKTWYVAAKYIIEKPDKAYEKLAELMTANQDIYGEIGSGVVMDSFGDIRLMSLNDNFAYFGLNGEEKKIDAIIADTQKTWQKFGDMSEDEVPADITSDSNLAGLFAENDEELLVGAFDSSITGNASQTEEMVKEFKVMDEVSIEMNTEKVAKVDIPPVFYDSGKATVKKESLADLNEVVNVLKQFPNYYLIIDAHTDSIGSEESNLLLSRERAETVKTYLISKKIDMNRLIARGWGESKPLIDDDKTEESKAKNRRTEFILTREAAAN